MTAHAPADPPAATVVVKAKHKGEHTAQWLTIGLIVFTCAIPFLHKIDQGGLLLAFIRDYFIFAALAYLAVEIYESSHRRISDGWGQFTDNLLAFIHAVVAIGWLLAAWLHPTFTMTGSEILLMFAVLAVDLFDLAFGYILPQRVASGARIERDEN